MNYDDLIAEIRTTFPEKRPFRFDPMANDDLREDPKLVARAFADVETWTELTPDFVDSVPDNDASAMFFLSDEAVCFYLPAFVIPHLLGQLDRVDPSFSLSHGFTDGTRSQSAKSGGKWWEYGVARWRSLTKPQVVAVTHYLEALVERGDDGLGDIGQALTNYWYPRIAGVIHE